MTAERFDGKKLELTEEEWRRRLTPEQFEVLRQGGTEFACANAYFKNKRKGIYLCAGCDLPLYRSDVKYESGTGWPSFTTPIFPENVTYREDHSHGMARVEVACSRCGGHLGHVFPDGPPPTGMRYCMNSAAMKFVEE